jgi:hypothetical protein
MKADEEVPYNPGALLVGGDWAIAHGDAGGLAYVAIELGMHCRGGLARELIELSRLCSRNFSQAANRWPTLRARLGVH